MAKTNIAIGVDPGNVWKHSILSRYQHQLKKEEEAEEKYLRAFERATITTQYIKGDRIQGGDKQDLYDRINALQPLRDIIRAEIKETARIRIETGKIIDSVESIKYKVVLDLLYLNGMDYKETGAKMRDSEKMSVLHNRALRLAEIDPI